jgi:long-chain acyl-CoA synthetase
MASAPATTTTRPAKEFIVDSVLDGFRRLVHDRPDGIAFRTIGGATWTWSDYADRAARFAAGLQELGVQRGDRIVLMVRNRLEFHVADTGALLAGATPVSIYNSSSADQIRYLAGHSRAVVAVTEAGEFAERFADISGLRATVTVGGASDGTTPYDELLGLPPVDLDAAAAAVSPDDLLTVIYTSGTTGPPKGVMLNHRNVLAQHEGLEHFLGPDGSGHRFVSYLPMAHVAERNLSHYVHLMWGNVVTPCADMSQLGAYLVAVRPTLLFGPPRVWEKLAAGIRAAIAVRPEEEQRVVADALRIGRQVQQLRATGAEPEGELAASWQRVDAGVFAPLRAMIGLDECAYAFSGAAPIPAEVIEFLRDIGLAMSEIYGMSENTGGMTWEPVLVKPGKVGRAYPGTEVITADDGEILCRGGIVFPGYLDDPERTREAIDEDGWLHTGDIGEIDADGYLRIVDRKKEILITAGGKNISPANLEAALKTILLVGQAMAVGDGRPYLVALLTLDPDAVAVRFPGRVAADVATDPAVIAEIRAGVAAVNERFSTVEHLRRIAILGEEWLPDTDVLTPTMKLKRRGVLARYGEQIEAMYAGGGIEIEAAGVQT